MPLWAEHVIKHQVKLYGCKGLSRNPALVIAAVIRIRRIKWNITIGNVKNVKTRNLTQTNLLQLVEV